MKTPLFILSFLILVSCSHQGTLEDEIALQETTDAITLDIDSETKFLTKAMFHFINEDGEEVISFEGDNKILFYRLKDGKLIHTVYLQKEGANGVGTVFGHYLNTMDSIYITRRNVPELYLVDRTGTVLDKYNYMEDNNGEVGTHAISSSIIYSPLVKIDERIFLNQFLVHGGNTTGELLEKNPLAVIINENTKQVEHSAVTYPRLWEGMDEFSFSEYSRIFDGERFIYSFFWDENMYVVDIDHTNSSKIPVKSKYIPALEKGKKRIQDFNAGLKNSIETARYGNIIYDPYREVYYRFAFPATTVGSDEDLQSAANFGREFSVIIFDKDLTILGETFFPDGEFVPSLFFVAKDGLYISNNHIKNPLFDEDRLIFKRFILDQEETGEQPKPEIKSLHETPDTPALSDTTIYVHVNVYPEILNQEELDNEKRFKDWSGEEDRIVYSLVVEPDGSISYVKLERSGAPELNEETLRLLKMAQFKAAQLEDGTIVRCKSMFMMRYP